MAVDSAGAPAVRPKWSPALVGFLLISGILTSALWAQPTSSLRGDSADRPPTNDLFAETVDVRVVNVEVVVTDRSGERVHDLGPEDFELRVDGRVVEVPFFSEVRGGRVAGVGAATPDALQPGEAVPVNYLVYVDDNRIVKTKRDIAMRGLRADLDRLRPQDRVAIVVQHGAKLHRLVDWTSDRSELEAAFQRLDDPKQFGGQLLSPLFHVRRQLTGSRGVDDLPERFSLIRRPRDLERAGWIEERRQELVDRRLAESGVTSTLQAMGQPLGRRVLLLLNGEEALGSFAMLDGAWHASSRLHVAASLIETANLLGYSVYPVVLDSTTSLWNNVANNTLARATGARALYRRSSALQAAIDDVDAYYWLGFTPPRRGDDLRHSLEVEVRDGLRARFRTSYVDLSSSARSTLRAQSALLFDEPADDLRIQLGEVRSTSFRKVTVPATILIPLEPLQPLPFEGERTIEVEVRFGVIDEAGSQAEITTIPLTMWGAYQPESAFRFETDLVLRKGPHRLVAVVVEPSTGTVLSGRAELGSD